MLLETGLDPEAMADEGVRLAMSLTSSSAPALRVLLSTGVDLTRADSYAWSALYWAAHLSDVDCVRLLLDAGSSPSGVSSVTGETPEILAAKRAHTAVCEMLRTAKTLCAALFKASRTGDSRTIRETVRMGPSVHVTGRHALSALHIAAEAGHLDACRVLVELDAKVNATARGGLTPPMAAVRAGRWAVAAALLEPGAGPSAETCGL
jgi:ankyrin repeat protein